MAERPFQAVMNVASPQARGLVFWVPGAPSQAPFASFANGGRRGTPQGGLPERPLRGGFVTGADYDGADDRLDVSNPGFDPADGFTLTAWLNPTVLVRATSLFYFTAHAAGDATQAQVAFLLGDGATSGAMGLNIARATSAMQRITQAGFVSQTWQHLAMNYNGGTTATGINIYRNAVASASYSVSTNGSGAITAGTGSFSVGGRIFDNARNWDGGIADVRVYNRVIGQAELTKLYKPDTRWDLYWQPTRRTYFIPSTATGRSFAVWIP